LTSCLVPPVTVPTLAVNGPVHPEYVAMIFLYINMLIYG